MLPLRSEIEKKDKWKIEDLFNTDEDFLKECDRIRDRLKKNPEYKGRLAKSVEALYECLCEMDSLGNMVQRVYVYAFQKYYEDTANTTYQDYSGKAQSISVEYDNYFAFVEPEILEIPYDVLDNFFMSDCGIRKYRQYIDNMLRRKKHILSETEEKLLAKAGKMSSGAQDIFSSFNNADVRFGNVGEEELTHGNYIRFLQSYDRNVRREAFEKMYAKYKEFKNTLASAYNANVEQASFFAQARKYGSTIEAALDDANIPVQVYDRLIEVVHRNLGLLHRYVNIRKKLLGVEELHMYDLYVPLVEDYDEKITFEEAKEKVLEGLAPLGAEYASILREGYNNGWIDVRENRGKRSGAFSWGAYGTHPYVFLNYQDNLDNVFTLAHEMGHAIHTYMSNASQPYVYSGYKIFVAEVASTCNEALLIRHLIDNADTKKEKAYLINHFLEQFRGTLFRQTMFAEFEREAHRMAEAGNVLTEEVLCDLYRELNRKYFGEGICVDEEIAYEWARIPHFYTPFYVYQYATGFSAAISISQDILDRGMPAVEGYFKFLRGGSSDYPIELLKYAGVDMMSTQAVENAMKVFEQYLDEFEKIML